MNVLEQLLHLKRSRLDLRRPKPRSSNDPLRCRGGVLKPNGASRREREFVKCRGEEGREHGSIGCIRYEIMAIMADYYMYIPEPEGREEGDDVPSEKTRNYRTERKRKARKSKRASGWSRRDT